MSSELISMIGNVSQSMPAVQHLVYGAGYVLGILFVFQAIQKFRKIGDKKGNSAPHERMFVPTAYLLGGAAMIFLPSMMGVLANTFFGVGNILQYATYNPYNIYSAMAMIIRTAGVIWFVRGCVLLTHASNPGVQDGSKGMMFLIAGILAMNFENTTYFLNWAVGKIVEFTLSNSST